jgi:putative spermidine/putrescine transport system ATP-binding protein
VAAVRPDDVRAGPAAGPGLRAVVEVVEYQGRDLAIEARTPDGMRIFLRTDQRLAPGDPVSLVIDAERLLLFPADDFVAPEVTLRADDEMTDDTRGFDITTVAGGSG